MTEDDGSPGRTDDCDDPRSFMRHPVGRGFSAAACWSPLNLARRSEGGQTVNTRRVHALLPTEGSRFYVRGPGFDATSLEAGLHGPNFRAIFVRSVLQKGRRRRLLSLLNGWRHISLQTPALRTRLLQMCDGWRRCLCRVLRRRMVGGAPVLGRGAVIATDIRRDLEKSFGRQPWKIMADGGRSAARQLACYSAQMLPWGRPVQGRRVRIP